MTNSVNLRNHARIPSGQLPVVVDTAADARDITSTLGYGVPVITAGALTADDGGGGVWQYVSGASAGTYTDNLGTVLVPTGGDGSATWLRLYSGPVNVRWFGAQGDCTTDDTSAIQAALDACVGLDGSALYLPYGQYLITDTLTITEDTIGLSIFGDGKRTEIIQDTDGKPIFEFAADAVSRVHMHDLYLRYTNQQAIGSDGAAVSFSSSASQSGLHYNSVFERIELANCNRGFGVDTTGGYGQCSVFGTTFRNITSGSDDGYCTGSVIRLFNSPALGQPNNRIDTVYVRADDMKEDIILANATGALQIDNIEVNNLDDTDPSYAVRVIYVIGPADVSIGAVRLEYAEFGRSGGAAIIIAAALATIQSFDARAVTFDPGAGGFAYLIRMSDPASADGNAYGGVWLGALKVRDSVETSGTARAVHADNEAVPIVIENVAQCDIDVTSTASEKIWVNAWNHRGATDDCGDADYTITYRDACNVIYNTTLTANRTVTLPDPSSEPVLQGMVYRVVRCAQTPGDYTLTLETASGATVATIPAGEKGTAAAIYVGGSNWREDRPARTNLQVAWADFSGFSPNRGIFDASTVTLQALATRVGTLIRDLQNGFDIGG